MRTVILIGCLVLQDAIRSINPTAPPMSEVVASYVAHLLVIVLIMDVIQFFSTIVGKKLNK
ncbi:MAG TPA: hypothetical protein VGD05_02270 [Pyrinomonadaceae bacterium]|jgi:hypothetical protein